MRAPATFSRPDADGFDDFVRDRAAPLTSLARGLARSDADADDLVQDTLAKVLLHWNRVRDAGDPAAYVNRMLVNTATSWWRRASRREAPTRSGELPDGVAIDPSAVTDDRDALVRALRALPVRHRAVLVLRYVEQLPDAEIADVLGIAQATVRSCAARGLASLRAGGALAEAPDDDPVSATRQEQRATSS